MAGPALLGLSLLALPAAGADRVFENLRGYTWTADGLRRFEALRISSAGRVVATGNSETIGRGDGLRHIDGKGATLLPGLIDAHGHVLDLGRTALQVDLSDASSLKEALRKVEAFATAHADASWILGRGWNQELWPSRTFPLASDLDAVINDRPVFLTRVDGHAAWANTHAMRLAGVDAQTREPDGGAILRTDEGEPSGVFVDAAMTLIESEIPQPTAAQDEAALLLAIEQLASVGVTSVHDAGVSAATVDLYRKLADEGRLELRVYAMLSGAEENLRSFEAPLIGYGKDRLTVRSVKLYADGALGSRGAALLAAYSDVTSTRGLLFHDLAEMRRLIEKINARGFQASVHAIGDAANRLVLDAFSSVQGGRPSGLRNRIEHAQVVAPDDLSRFRELGLVASMQFTHATSDKNMAEARVGPDRIEGAYAWRSLVDRGTLLAGGSDFPVEDPNPFFGLHAAVARQDRHGRPPGGWYAGQALNVGEALRAFTLNAAYAAHQEDRLGSLEPGKWADFILVDRDPFSIPARDLWRVQVVETWLAGERIYWQAAENADFSSLPGDARRHRDFREP
ncbi:MAG: amidohydrolase [Gammaproteobacteria bacterium]|nr:amidohydrolase [Gammaproteobacteria bacterium]